MIDVNPISITVRETPHWLEQRAEMPKGYADRVLVIGDESVAGDGWCIVRHLRGTGCASTVQSQQQDSWHHALPLYQQQAPGHREPQHEQGANSKVRDRH